MKKALLRHTLGVIFRAGKHTMAIINSQIVVGESWRPELEKAGFNLIYSGKVRDMFSIPYSGWEDWLLMVARDSISINDFVLGTPIPRKGEVLTGLTQFWFTQVLKDFPHHLHPEPTALRDLVRLGAPVPVTRALVVRRLKMEPIEFVFRQHLGGSVWKEYEEYGTIAGIHDPKPKLEKWGRLEQAAFTPATKATDGHDINITRAKCVEIIGEEKTAYYEDLFRSAYLTAYSYAAARGIVILDTKFEGGAASDGTRMIGDEVLTPDSSRFTDHHSWQLTKVHGSDPQFLDKQFVREWGAKVETSWGLGIKPLDPTNPEHVAFVSGVPVPQEVIEETQKRYFEIFRRLTGSSLDDYQHTHMLCYW